MRSRWIVSVAAVLTLGTLGLEISAAADSKPQTPAPTNEASVFPWSGSNSRATLALRQRLRDKVCYALADGQIDQAERTSILTYAQSVLGQAEYANFKHQIDKIAPPLSPAEKQKLVARNLRRQRSTVVARAGTSKVVSSKVVSSKVVSSKAVSPEVVSSKSSTEPTYGTEILVSDRMASDGAAR
ncbi:MAG: hypothetical protein LLF97_13155 [Planctomycetaceae bacterium]|nr:hypothetical protein [Planctomycetaceae bacterium]